METITQTMVWHLLPVRRADANKGDCGRVLALAGSLGYRGAAALCTEGALRAGAGLVFLAAPDPVLTPALTRTPECCALPCAAGRDGCTLPAAAARAAAAQPAEKTVLLAGPGLGAGAGALLTAVLGAVPRWRAVVLDADALGALAAGACPPPPPLSVLTPHPGEAARLLHTTPAAVQADRPAAAAALARQYGAVAVLKGSGTLVALPDGRLWQNTTGGPGLARGGSGDLLAGMLAGLLAQGLCPEAAACCGVWLHGAAADRCAARRGIQTMLPHELVDDLCALFAEQQR